MTNESQTKTLSESVLPLPPNIHPESLSANSKPPSIEAEGISPPKTTAFSASDADGSHVIPFAHQAHTYMSEYIKLADQKAAFFFAAATGLIALLCKDQSLLVWLVDPRGWTLKHLVAFIATAGLSFQALMCLFTAVPRLKGSKRGFLYFMAVAEYPSSEQYASDILKLTESDIARIWLTHSHELALIAKKKYQALSFGMKAGAVGTVAALVLLLLH